VRVHMCTCVCMCVCMCVCVRVYVRVCPTLVQLCVRVRVFLNSLQGLKKGHRRAYAEMELDGSLLKGRSFGSHGASNKICSKEAAGVVQDEKDDMHLNPW